MPPLLYGPSSAPSDPSPTPHLSEALWQRNMPDLLPSPHSVGTKSLAAHNVALSAGGGEAAARMGPATPPIVTVYNKRLHYDFRYGVPAALVFFIIAAVTLVLIACLLFRFKYKDFIQLLNQTSTCRVVTNMLDPCSGVCEVKTKNWVAVAGATRLKYPFYTTRLVQEDDDATASVETSQVNSGSAFEHNRASSSSHAAYHTAGGGGDSWLERNQSGNGGEAWQPRPPLMSDPGVSSTEEEVGRKDRAHVWTLQL